MISVDDHVFYSSNRRSKLAPTKIPVWSFRDNQIEEIGSGKMHHLPRSYDTVFEDCQASSHQIEAQESNYIR